MLQSLQKGMLATGLSLVTQMVLLVLFLTIMYLTDRHNAPRIEWAYPLSFVFGGAICILVLFFPVKNLYMLMKEADNGSKNDVDEHDKIEVIPEL